MTEDQWQKVPRLRPELTLDKMKELCKGYLPELIGMELVSASAGKLVSRLKVRHDLMAPNGFLHAATIIGLADTSCGFGTLAHLPEGAEPFTTIELKTNFLRYRARGRDYLRGKAGALRTDGASMGRRGCGRSPRPKDCPFPVYPDDSWAKELSGATRIFHHSVLDLV